jgi:hypothetical protein
MRAFERGNRSRHSGRDHRDLQAHPRRTFEFADRFIGSVHRDRGGRRDSVAKLSADLRVHRIQGATCDPPHLGIEDRRQRQPERGIQNGKIDAELIKPAVQQARRHHGREIVRVVRDAPPGAAHVARVAISARARRMLAQLAVVSLEHPGSADFLKIFVEERCGLDQMAVAVDHRMIEPVAERSHSSNVFAVHP